MSLLMILLPLADPAEPGGATGSRLDCFLGPFFTLRDSGQRIVLASPEGGFPWTRLSRDDEVDTALMRRFRADRAAREEVNDTLRLDQIYAEDFDGAFCVGQSGAIRDNSSAAARLISTFLQSGKPVALVPAAVDIAPAGSGNSVLIVDDHRGSSLIIAEALIIATKSKLD